MPPKSELEQIYGPPWSGLDYSKPYTTIDANSLAPGSVNTQSINGMLSSSPWIADKMFGNTFAGNEFVMGIFNITINSLGGSIFQKQVLIITNVAAYISSIPTFQTAATFSPANLILIHTWIAGDINQTSFGNPMNACSFVEIDGVVYISSLTLNGIFQWDGSIFATSTGYVSAAYMIELGGRLVVAECRFPTGGGTGTAIKPTVAWSAVGVFTAFDPLLNPQAGFNLLSDVPDFISGLAQIGRSALIFRLEGLSQMDPNSGSSNSGLQPFVFYHLWASVQGIGAFPGSVSQYGDTCYFRADDGVYTISIGGGLQNIGRKIIDKITDDFSFAGKLPQVNFGCPINNWGWYFGSVVHIGGQLHYLLTFSTSTVNPAIDFTTVTYTAIVYDFNIAENSWHIWDTRKYSAIAGGLPSFVGFSCPIVQCVVSGNSTIVNPPAENAFFSFEFILFGGFTTYGTLTSFAPAGIVNQCVPFSYGFNNNFVTPYVAALYPPLYVPQTQFVFRGEITTLGHKTTQRRLRIQADNAPMPTVQAGAQQTAQVQLAGPSVNPSTQTGTVKLSDLIFMGGNQAPIGLPIKTYYGDAVLADEMVQASIVTPILDSDNPWKSLAAFRIATVSLILTDTKGATQ